MWAPVFLHGHVALKGRQLLCVQKRKGNLLCREMGKPFLEEGRFELCFQGQVSGEGEERAGTGKVPGPGERGGEERAGTGKGTSMHTGVE